MKFLGRRFGAFFVITAFTLVLVGATVNADGVMWSSGEPSVEQNISAGTASDWQDRCKSQFHSFKQNIELATYSPNNQTECYLGNAFGVNVFSYATNSALAVQFPGDSRAYRTNTYCFGCVYSSDTDKYITVEYNNTAGTGRVAVYDNFLSRLSRVDSGEIDGVYYEMDPGSARYISNYFGQPGYFGYIKHMGISSNGKWLVVEVVGKGLFRVDLDTMQMLKFTNWTGRYGVGSDAHIEFDVTDDGEHVAVFGMNSQQAIYDITPECGIEMPDSPTEEDANVSISYENSCPALSLNDPEIFSEPLLENFRHAYQPQFSYDGGEITFIATNNDYLSDRRITLQAQGYVPALQLDYLALGDSYSSGEGDTEKDENGDKYYRPLTDVDRNDETVPEERCHVSTRSYPFKLAQGMGLALDSPKQWDTVACSGAKIWDASGKGSSAYLGQWDRLKGFDVSGLKDQALNEFVPGRVKQIEFVKRYQPKVITLTMGGNDVGFADKIMQCITSLFEFSCDYVNRSRNKMANEIYGQYDKLKSFYEELYNASNYDTKLYILGYPNFINGADEASCDLNVGSLNGDERELIVNSISYLNNVIKRVAEAAGAKYIDIEDSLVGHRFCDDGEKYMTGITDGLDYGQNLQESFHPNAKGHNQIAISVWDNMWNEDLGQGESLLDYDICPESDENICPDSSATKDTIEIPAYFADVASDKNVENKRMTEPVQKKDLSLKLKLEPFSFAPNSSVSTTLYSDPIDMGAYSAGSDGSLDTSLVLPDSIPAGYHTIVVEGQTYSGEPIQYEQTILIKGADENDIDDDGIVDAEDACLFVSASGVDYDQDDIDDACDPEIGEVPEPTPSPTPTPSPSPSPTPPPVNNPPSNPITNIINAIVKIVSAIFSFFSHIFSFRFK